MRWKELDEDEKKEAQAKWKNPPFQTGQSRTISTCLNTPASIIPDHEDSVRGKILTYLCKLRGRSFDHALEAMTIAVETNLNIELQKPVDAGNVATISRDAEITGHVHRSMQQCPQLSNDSHNSTLLSAVEYLDAHRGQTSEPTTDPPTMAEEDSPRGEEECEEYSP